MTDLRRWARHNADCPRDFVRGSFDPWPEKPCTCGLDAALASQPIYEMPHPRQPLTSDTLASQGSGADAHLGTLRAAGYVQHLPKCRKRSKRMIIHNGARIQEGTAPFVQCTCGLSSKLAALITEGETRT